MREDKAWQCAPIVITSNKKRLLINKLPTKFWALHHKTPRFVWAIPLVRRLASSVPNQVNKYFYENYPALTGCFVAGAPGTKKVNSIIVK